MSDDAISSAEEAGMSDTEALRDRIADGLDHGRARTARLTGGLDDEDLIRQHSPLMSPLVWDLAHVGNQEELWLVRDVGGLDPVRADIDDLYDAFAYPRRDRPRLPLLGPAQARQYVGAVRDRALDVLDRADLSGRPVVDDGFAFAMIIQHEAQHDETMLATHQLRTGPPVLQAPPPPRAPVPVGGEVLIPGGRFTMGSSAQPWALDNERPAHEVDVAPYFIDVAPVTNGQYAAFVAEGGYDEPRWWSEAGWRYRMRDRLSAPMHWRRDATGWVGVRFGVPLAIAPDEPVVHVSYFEAEAFAAWVGKRLPTEAEWEKAARFEPETHASREFPWGDGPPTMDRANLGQRHLGPAPVGAFPAGASPYGVHQLIGDVWEWTSTDFAGYPGFVAFPYREYSEVFFGPTYKVLRGGSFGTDAVAARATFRNWDFPVRRQIFSGLRCARDADIHVGTDAALAAGWVD